MRYYSSTASEKTLTSAVTSSDTTVTLSNLTGLPSSYPYTLVLDPDTASEEIVLVTSLAGGTVLNVVRGADTYGGVEGGNGTAKQTHDAGAKAKHMVTARDLQEPQDHINATSSVHGVTGDLVGTSSTQTLSNKTLASPTVTGTATVASLTATGTVTLPSTTSIGDVSATELSYVNGVTSAIQTQLDALSSSGVTGSMVAYLGTSAPSGYLMCDGTAVSRTTYSALFALIGTRYGSGDGSTTFNLPDLRSRFPRGAATVASPSGSAAGSDTHSHSGSSGSGGSHSHTYSTTTGSPSSTYYSVSGGNPFASPSHTHSVSGTTSTDGSHSHSVSVDSGSNVPAYIEVNWIVKA